jgi:hypothetical protein
MVITNRSLLLAVSLVISGSVGVVAEVSAIPVRVSKLAHTGEYKVQNIATGSFPANPTYGAIQLFGDAECSDIYMAQSFLLDTCMSSDATSVLYTCGMGYRTEQQFAVVTYGLYCSERYGPKDSLQ